MMAREVFQQPGNQIASDRSRRSERKVSIALFVAAITLYLPGIWWGLPYATAPDRIKPWGSDELAPLGPLSELYNVFLAPNPTFNPQYPLFHYVIQAMSVGPYMGYLWLTNQLSHPSVEYPYGLSNPVLALAVMTLLARVVSVLMAAGIIVIAYRTAIIMWDRRTGLVTGVMVLLMYPMFYYSRTSNVDLPALFWTSLGLYVFANSVRGTWTSRRALWLGLFAALATATKDASYSVFVMVALVLLPLHFWRQRQSGESWLQTLKGPAIFFFAGLSVYLLASGLVLHPGRYWVHLNFITHGSQRGQVFYFSTPPTLNGYLSLGGQTVIHLVDALSMPVMILALVGIVLCALRARQTLLFGVPALGILLGVILPARFVLLRFVLIIAYVLAFYAAYAVGEVLRVRRPLFHMAALLLLVYACGWPLLRGVDLTRQMIDDSRYQVATWFQQNAREKNHVGYYGAPLKLPALEAGIVTMPMPGQLETPARENTTQVVPEFIIVIPQQPFEPLHEWTMPEEVYRALCDGTMGYQQVLDLQPRTFFSKRPISFVNPPVKVFARKDHLARTTDEPRLAGSVH